MPKKNSSWGVNSKAAEANARKAEKKRSEQDAKQKAIEDSYWEDNHKLDAKKKERKEREQQKKLEVLSRKQEAKKLLEEEEKSIGSISKPSSSKGSKKVTQCDINKLKEIERKKIEQRNQLKEKEIRKVSENPEIEPENPNRKMAEILASENAVEARSVEDALSILSCTSEDDKHPEKRMKAAYTAFEKRELPILKEENPNLRLSQLKQILRKEWQRSPDNPMNK